MLSNASSLLSVRRATFALLAVLAAGCGGKVIADGVASEGTGGAGGATSSTTGSTVDTGVGGALGAGGFGTGPSTSTATTTTGPTTATATTGTGMTTGTTTSTTTTTGAGGATPVAQVYCNNQPCNDGEICCFNLTMPTDHCGQAGNCGGGYIELDCNGPEDCPNNQICCAHLDPNQGMVPYTGIVCQDSCQGMNERIVCGQAGTAVCNPGDTCKNSNVLGNGYKVCRP
ncbi:MAG: hypothetical protein U0359_11665 [Byssovorax sp.]